MVYTKIFQGCNNEAHVLVYSTKGCPWGNPDKAWSSILWQRTPWNPASGVARIPDDLRS